jgi:hypothetical protein
MDMDTGIKRITTIIIPVILTLMKNMELDMGMAMNMDISDKDFSRLSRRPLANLVSDQKSL